MIKDKKLLTRSIIAIIVISVIGLFFVLWVTYLYPLVEGNLRVWQLFLIFYVLVVSFWMALFIGLFGFHKVAIKTGIIMSIVSAVIDIFYPPYSVNMDGSLISSATVGYKGSIDYTLGYYLNCFGIHGFIVFLLTYCIIPGLTFFVVLVVLRAKAFIDTMKRTV